MNKKLVKYREEQSRRWEFLHKRRAEALLHPDYPICRIQVDMLTSKRGDHDYGYIIGISPTREGFDELYKYSNMYRGGIEEIKVGANYVAYGFEFD